MISKIKEKISLVDIKSISIEETLLLVKIIKEIKRIENIELEMEHKKEMIEVFKTLKQSNNVSTNFYDIHKEQGD